MSEHTKKREYNRVDHLRRLSGGEAALGSILLLGAGVLGTLTAVKIVHEGAISLESTSLAAGTVLSIIIATGCVLASRSHATEAGRLTGAAQQMALDAQRPGERPSGLPGPKELFGGPLTGSVEPPGVGEQPAGSGEQSTYPAPPPAPRPEPPDMPPRAT